MGMCVGVGVSWQEESFSKILYINQAEEVPSF